MSRTSQACWRPLVARPRPGAVYNVCDDLPAPPQDVVTMQPSCSAWRRRPAQDYATAELSPMARTFYQDNRRVRNIESRRSWAPAWPIRATARELATLLAQELSRPAGR
ncbi:MAG: hypothetical protein U1E17_08385 [Geminicoccaceae bacterium]